MKITDVMTRDPVVIRADDSLAHAGKLMKEHEIGILPVSKDGTLSNIIGVITDRDITIRGAAEARNINNMKVSEILSPKLCFCYSNDDLELAVVAMKNRKVKRVLVFDSNQHNLLVGVITLGDLATSSENQKMYQDVLQVLSQAPATRA